MTPPIKAISKFRRYMSVLAFAPFLGCGGTKTEAASASTANPSDAVPVATEGKIANKSPILDTHIHLYTVSRPGGVVWPEPQQKKIYRDITPAEYKEVAEKNGIIGTGIVEASPKVEDNFKVLDAVKGDDFFRFLVAQLELGSPEFTANLAKLTKDPRVVGIRGFLWSPKMTLDEKQLASCKELAAQGMTLDIISRGTLNPKDKVEQLATAVPKLRIIIDHLAGAKGKTPDPAWVTAVEKLAKHPNIYIKFSSFFDMYNPGPGEDNPWTSPTDASAYKEHFDVLFNAFGEDRLIWGSNWPVVELGGSLEDEIKVAEDYLASHGDGARDKVMRLNAEKFYRRQP